MHIEVAELILGGGPWSPPPVVLAVLPAIVLVMIIRSSKFVCKPPPEPPDLFTASEVSTIESLHTVFAFGYWCKSMLSYHK